MNIAKLYSTGQVNGWLGEEFAREQFKFLSQNFYTINPNKFRNNFSNTGKMMLYECVRKVFGKDTPNVGQKIGDCFLKNTPVLMADGSEKNIEDIKIGDEIISHLNQKRKVVDVFKKKYSGKIVEIQVNGYHETIKATEDHKFVYLPFKSSRKSGYKYQGWGWRQIGKLSVGDRISIPYGTIKAEDIYINYYGRKILVDEKFARIIGLYLAEGGTDGKNGEPKRVRLSLGSHERLLAEEACELFNSVFGLKAVIRLVPSKPTVITVEVGNADFARWIKKFIPGNVYTKAIPKEFFKCKRNIKISLLRGWMDGDGNKNKRSVRITGVTSSRKLSKDIYRLCLSCKINPKSLLRKKASHQRVPATQIDFYGNEALEIYPNLQEICNKPIRNLNSNITPFGISAKVKEIKEEYVTDVDVYCIEVEEDHGFIANGFGVSNCVSWGYRNAAEQLQACQIILEKKREKFKLLFPPYIYGTSRVLVGRQRSRSDGSTGAWASQAVMKYGVLAEDEKGVPTYSGKVASDWGYSGPPNEFVELGKKHLVKSAALVTTWEQMCTAIGNGYPVAICSDQGFQMMPGRDGFHEASGTWNHCMDVCGFDNNYSEPYCIVMNSWGDSPNVHGELFDFDTKERLPGGCLRVRKRVMSRILSQGDSYALSFMEGFEDTSLERDLFDFVSDWRW